MPSQQGAPRRHGADLRRRIGHHRKCHRRQRATRFTCQYGRRGRTRASRR
nr:MAG TPA: hypothetical protein [Caudoviricetes sp.]